MIRKKWKIEILWTLLIFLLLLYSLSHLMKNRRCKGLRQKQEIENAPKENISLEENLMLERLNHVKKVCKEIKATSNDFCSFKSKYHEYDQAISGRNHIQDPNTGTIYCFNHKVASSTWMSFFARMQSRTQQFQNIIKSEKYYKVKDILSADDLTVMDEDNTAFIIVRHPLDRLISAFTDRILNNQTDQVKSHTIFLMQHIRYSKYKKTQGITLDIHIYRQGNTWTKLFVIQR